MLTRFNSELKPRLGLAFGSQISLRSVVSKYGQNIELSDEWFSGTVKKPEGARAGELCDMFFGTSLDSLDKLEIAYALNTWSVLGAVNYRIYQSLTHSPSRISSTSAYDRLNERQALVPEIQAWRRSMAVSEAQLRNRFFQYPLGCDRTIGGCQVSKRLLEEFQLQLKFSTLSAVHLISGILDTCDQQDE